jgi:uncharacterized protein YciI
MTKSTLYVIRTTNRDLSKFEEQLPAHLAWVKKNATSGVFLFSGPLENRSEGGVIVARAKSREALDLILRNDPFLTSGVATHEVLTFDARFGSQTHIFSALPEPEPAGVAQED